MVCSYTPLGGDACQDGTPHAWGENALPFVSVTTGFSGPRYIKAQYVEYMDPQFTQRKNRSEADGYMGILGPTLRAEVGDTIKVNEWHLSIIIF